MKSIEDFTKTIVNEYRSTVPSNAFGEINEVIGICPRCGSEVICGRGRYYCANPNCSFCMWEDNKFFSAKRKKLTKHIAAELLKTGRAKLSGCYSEKSGKTYDATVLLDDKGGKYVNFKMEFDKPKNNISK